MHAGQQMFRGEITVRRSNRSSCPICQSDGWHSAFSFTASENINQTSVICPHSESRGTETVNGSAHCKSTFKATFGLRLCPNKKLIMLLAASISRFLFLFQEQTQRKTDRPSFHGQSLQKHLLGSRPEILPL